MAQDLAQTTDAITENPADSALRERVVAAIKTVYDPEIPVNIWELGLIYDIIITGADHVHVCMTLTAPACPVAGTLPGEVEARIRQVEGVSDAMVELVWTPPWNQNMMSEEARLELGLL
jgi:FeS assembly SUF system protein